MSRDNTTFQQTVLEAATVLRNGGNVAFPTETVYGLGADARNIEAVNRIFAIKGRPADHPLIVHLADESQLPEWAREIPSKAWQLARAFWPGPLTLILNRRPEVPDAVTGGLETVALRVPSHPLAQALLSAFGGGVAAPSANRYGRVSPTTADDVRSELGSELELILDGGPCQVGIESTIVDMTSASPRILRPGAITEEDLFSILGDNLTPVTPSPVHCPGNKPSHYAPRSRVIIATHDNAISKVTAWHIRGNRVGLLSPSRPPDLPSGVSWLDFTKSNTTQAMVLYQRFRQADQLGLQILVVVMPPEQGLGIALRDRLLRAAGLGSITAQMSDHTVESLETIPD